MTENQLLHKLEQGDALRAEFDRLWDSKILPLAIGLAGERQLSAEDIAAIVAHCCFQSFVEGRKKR